MSVNVICYAIEEEKEEEEEEGENMRLTKEGYDYRYSKQEIGRDLDGWMDIDV